MSDYYPTGADGHSLIMPFVTCASKGGPHDAEDARREGSW